MHSYLLFGTTLFISGLKDPPPFALIHLHPFPPSLHDIWGSLGEADGNAVPLTLVWSPGERIPIQTHTDTEQGLFKKKKKS